MDKKEIDKLKSAVDIKRVIGQFITLERAGNEYKGCCPFHQEDTPSFHVNEEKQTYHCFGCDAGGDVITFVQKFKGLSFRDAISWLYDYSGQNPGEQREIKKQTGKEVYKNNCRLIVPIPDNIQLPSQSFPVQIDGVYKQYPITATWAYRGASGGVETYDVRFDTPKGKMVAPLSYCVTPSGNNEWTWSELHKPSLLYNTDLLSKYQELPVFIVEGCKCATALQEQFDLNDVHSVVITWRGGCNQTAIKKADWEKVKNRDVVIWPDFDWKPYKTGQKKGEIKPLAEQDGYVAALKIATILKVNNKKVEILQPQPDKPDGWDCADAIQIDKWDYVQIQEYINKYKVPFDEKKTITFTDSSTFFKTAPFSCLGYDDINRYYFPEVTQKVKAIKEDGHNATALLPLAPKEFWIEWFPHKEGVDWQGAASYLLHCKESQKVYNRRNIRGRGAWIDKDRIVLHMGDRLVVDGKDSQKLKIDNSIYIYEKGISIEDNLTNPLSDADSGKLLDIIDKLNFASKSQVIALAGFCVLAPICGALSWRPHVWLTGGKGTGKTTVMRDIVKMCIGPFALNIIGDSSAKGISQTLRLDALSVIYDESEGENRKRKERIQEIIELARISSSESGAREVKGSSNFKAVDFETRSMFIMASTGVNIFKSTDQSRFTIVELVIPRNVNPAVRTKEWQDLEKRIKETITPEYCSSLRARTIGNIPIIKKNAEIFSNAVANHLDDKRAGDQFGILFSAAYSLANSGEVDSNSAAVFVKEFDFSSVYDRGLDDEYRLINVLLQHVMKLDNNKELSIEEMIGEIMAPSLVEGDEAKMALYNQLKRIGIRADRDYCYRTKWFLWIANAHSGIEKILDESEWPRKWSYILKRFPGSVQKNLRYTGTPTMSTGIPMELILPKED
ncbi:MAG: hypothetical protein JW915_24150 [Chitinispirillaceae bacterium]|nr:hypothetical protein [Chitinispirillaceae bacterium]